MNGLKVPVYEDLGGEYGNILLHVYADQEHPILFIQVVYPNNIEDFFAESLPMDAVTIIYPEEEEWETKGWRFGRLGMQPRVPIFFSRELAAWYITNCMGTESPVEIKPCVEIKEKSEKYFSHGAYIILEETKVELMESTLRNIIETRDRINTGITAIEAKIKKIKPEVTVI